MGRGRTLRCLSCGTLGCSCRGRTLLARRLALGLDRTRRCRSLSLSLSRGGANRLAALLGTHTGIGFLPGGKGIFDHRRRGRGRLPLSLSRTRRCRGLSRRSPLCTCPTGRSGCRSRYGLLLVLFVPATAAGRLFRFFSLFLFLLSLTLARRNGLVIFVLVFILVVFIVLIPAGFAALRAGFLCLTAGSGRLVVLVLVILKVILVPSGPPEDDRQGKQDSKDGNKYTPP